MGSRGPKPLPTATKRARGTYRRDRDPVGDEPAVSKRAPIKIPEIVLGNSDALACWRSLAPKLRAMKVLSSNDVLLLESLCMAQATATAAARELAGMGGRLTIIGSHGGPIANPLIKIERDARTQVHRYSAEFGLTPSARTRVRAETTPEKSKGKASKDPRANPDAFFFPKGRQQQGKVVGSIAG